MEQNGMNPKYTKNWLGLQIIYTTLMAILLALVAGGIDLIAYDRFHAAMLTGDNYELVSQSIFYCFAIVAITSFTVILIELAFRKNINFLQYVLIGLALTLFYLLLLAFSEKISFNLSYIIASVMTIGLITIFMQGLCKNIKVTSTTLGALLIEFGLLFLLVKLDSMTLLVGSLSLFIMICLAMYLSLRLKTENNELILK
ncbi:MAG: cell envelope integrity protein CreD [Muribaculaceae bacterium]|nr:cell envelope integrity protein CreD [Muribaculaceae bacterium]